MFIDSKTVPKGSLIKSDICIVGAGAAGIALAMQFTTSSKKIVVLEGGGFEHNAAIQDLHDFENADLPVSKNSRVRRFGGTTTAWLGIWKYHDPIDFQERPWVKNSGWPIDYQDLLPYYERASRFAGVAPDDRFAGGEAMFENEIFQTAIFHRLPDEHLDFGKRFKRELENSNNIAIYLGANVEEIMANANRSRIEKAQVKTLGGNQFQVQAEEFVLAAGAIENARLLLLSNIGNAHDQVGRYYMDHPKGVAGEIVLRKSRRSPLYWGSGKPHWSRIGGVRLTPETQKKYGILNSLAMLIPKDRSFANRIGSKVFNRSPKAAKIAVRNFMEQEPDPENRISLSKQTDALGMRKAKISWNIGSKDKDTMIMFHKLLAEEIARQGIGSFVSPLVDGQREAWPISQDASHHMGTTRMGNDPRSSVADKNLRVHAIDNLYLAGSSVFPTSGYANPTATIIALTLRLADHLKGQS